MAALFLRRSSKFIQQLPRCSGVDGMAASMCTSSKKLDVIDMDILEKNVEHSEPAHPDFYPSGFFQNLDKATSGVVEKFEASAVSDSDLHENSENNRAHSVTLSSLESTTPSGQLDAAQLKLIYKGVRNEPANWTPTHVAAKFSIKTEQAEKLLKYFRTVRFAPSSLETSF